MPRPILPAGRPGTPVIPPGALDMHRRVTSSDQQMPYRVTIADPDRHTTDPGTGQAILTAGEVHYTNRPARLYPVPLNQQQIDMVGQAEQKSRWYLRLPLDTTVQQNQRVTVDSADPDYADTTLVGRVFRVLDPTPQTFGIELRVTVSEEPVPRAT